MTETWNPPAGWRRIGTVDAHAAGEPLRVIVSGLPPIPGETMLEKRRYAREHLDGVRTSLMWEPRGHADMYGAIPTEPVSPDSRLGVLFLHNEGFSTMCGHGIIALATVASEMGMVNITAEHPVLKIDTPAGQVEARLRLIEGRVKEVSFLNVPSFVLARDLAVDIPGVGTIKVDVAFGGAFYAFCRARDLGVRLVPGETQRLTDLGVLVKRVIRKAVAIHHPENPDLEFLYGTIFVGEPENPAHHSRNVCIFADGELDRSPTGTGVSARAAIHSARGELGLNEPFVVESILGTTFTGRVDSLTNVGPYAAVIPEVTGSAHITGRHEFLMDPADPLLRGFLLKSADKSS